MPFNAKDRLLWALEELDPRMLGRDAWRTSALKMGWRLATLPLRYRLAGEELELLCHGFSGERPGHRSANRPGNGHALQGTVAYLASTSLPYHIAGYTVRTQELVRALRALGLDAKVLTPAGYPLSALRAHKNYPSDHVVDGVPYHRLAASVPVPRWVSSRSRIAGNAAATADAVRASGASIIHAASNFVTGLAGIQAARRLGIPSVYEVRGLWEVTIRSRNPAYGRSLHYAQAVRLETEACLGADKVIALTGALKNELIRRGVPAEKIVVVRNGVDTKRFQPRPRDSALAQRLSISESDVTVGYVGTISDYEGIDDLFRAAKLCIDRGAGNLRLLVVGDGPALPACKALAAQLEIGGHVRFVGRVPHDEVRAYYSLIDIAPFPRKPLPVCEMVAPLKPYEAMAMGKCVIVSSVAALAEIVGSRRTGLIHEKGSVEQLASCLGEAILDHDLRRALGLGARAAVIADHDWRARAEHVADLYRDLAPDRVWARDAPRAVPAQSRSGFPPLT